jgi:GR25 family glycosyltransferase involved in LPS biosynthesis
MQCLYINLDSATQRRSELEASFASAQHEGWELIRVAATTPAEVADMAGSITPVEKACFASHRAALARAADAPGDVLIVEDDTRFSPRTFDMLGKLSAAAPQFDVLFTEVMPTDVGALANLARQWPRLSAAGHFLLQDLSRLGFYGAGSYLVRGPSKGKLLGLLDAAQPRDRPYDIVLRDLALSGAIRAAVSFPFLTTPGDAADASSIQSSATDLREGVTHAFRRLMFVDRDLPARRAEAHRLDAAHADEGAKAFGAILAALISDSFPDCW